ncbi:iron-containing alcohol dehydrogenase [Xenorhabdus bovienii]|nr:iron-containing alcohol dehydrogenase [Xenorhabdus bovienii]MDE9447133.1 iron-containing alcohol dehydrogenase [Xenorhabdus bovienii]MDE9536419.1 iron-containing alcohol dehydrogenase [Xenorhabdus bovienii]MDE9589599.1 iron-containing alcohol dehydrogenase [Xenorhabdus bovienii]
MTGESALSVLDNFSFALPVRIIFEKGALRRLTEYLSAADKSNTLLVMSKSASERFCVMKNLIEERGGLVKYTPWILENDFKATTESLCAIQNHLRNGNYDSIVSIGGGNIIDFTKVAAICLDNSVDISDAVGKTFDKIIKKIFHIAVPTTFGTGSEVTKGAIIFDKKKNIKDGVRGDSIFPDVALIDPSLGSTMPDAVLRETLFDSFTHVFEALHSVKFNPVTESLAVESLKRINANIERYAAGELDEHFYTEAAYSALLGGICVCHNSTCLPHRFEQAFAPFYSFSHGRGLAAIYPYWVRALMTYGKVSPQLVQVTEDLSASEYVAYVIRKLQLDSAAQQLASLKLSGEDIRKRVTGNIVNDPLVSESDHDIIATLLTEITGA